MQYQHTKRELEMAELIEGSERDRRRLAELLDGIRVGPGVDAMADGMREAVWADVRSRIRRRGIRMRIVRYAAAAAVMAGVVCGSWFMGGRRTESRLVAAAQPVSVSTPLGVKSDVVLPDGSRVRLNGGTRIVYPALFGDERRVEVDGEAYFDVTHDAGQPFVVTAPAFRVRVLGTVFNVRSFSGEPVAEATLAEGSVALQHAGGRNLICLHPGQQAVYDAEAELLEVNEVPVGALLLIRYGVVTLANATLPEIVARIERTYGVSLRIGAQQIPGERYNFSFQKDASVEDVVELLQFVSGCRFEIIQLNR